MAKLLAGYGERVQESAFEAVMSKREYQKLLGKVSDVVSRDVDSVRIYKITDQAGAYMIGQNIIVDPCSYSVV